MDVWGECLYGMCQMSLALHCTEGDNATPELTSSLTAPSSSQLIFIKLNICAVSCKGRNINQDVRGASMRAALTAGQARPPPCHGAPV